MASSALVDEFIPNLINGVSQQPPTLRLSSQAEVEENSLPTIAEGNKKRPPLDHVAQINKKTDELAYNHQIDRSDTEQFNVIITSEQFDESFSSDFSQADFEITRLSTGVSVPVIGNTGDITTYLTSYNPRDAFRMVTVADFTFILNKDITAAKSATVSDSRAKEGIVFLKQTTNATALKIFIDGVQRSSQSSNDADVVISGWHGDLIAALGSTFTFTKFGSSNIHITKNDGSDFTLHVVAPEANAIAIKDTVDSFTNLPLTTKDGFVVKVTGEPGTPDDDYWVEHSNQGDEDSGEWTETVEPGLANALDASTMPIQLVRSDVDPWDDAFSSDFGQDDFSLEQITWADRLAGDTTTNADPVFIGEKITDLGFHKSRLALLAAETISLSEVGEFFNFYKTTVTDDLASDPFDRAADANDVNIQHSFVPFNENLLSFSGASQFKLSSTSIEGLTPSATDFSLITEFQNDPLAHPIGVGRKIYFAEDRDGFAALREFGIVEDLQEETAEDITSHVPSYIEGSVTRIAPSASDNLFFVISTESKNEVYLYKFLIERGRKILSSWSKWVFPTDEVVLDVHFIKSIAYFKVMRSDGIYLEKVSLQDKNLIDLTPSTTQLTFKPLLDRQTTVTGVYDSGTDLTTWTMPYPDSSTEMVLVFGPGFGTKAGGFVQGTSRPSDTTITASGDHSDGFCFLGRKYTYKREFSEPIRKQRQADGGETALVDGTWKIKKLDIRHFKTAFYQIEVEPEGRDTYTYTYAGRTLGSQSNLIGVVPSETGNFIVKVRGKSSQLKVTLKSDSYLPCAFISARWIGKYVTTIRG